MARTTGSSPALEALKRRNPVLFKRIHKDIKRIGIKRVAKEANLSRQSIYNFLAGSQGVSPEAETKIYDVIEVLKTSDKAVRAELDRRAKKAVAA